MTAQIFLSCGQADTRERDAAVRVREALNAQGFNVYVAIQAQSIQDVNTSIIRQLERSDYYLFIDFLRESLAPGQDSNVRGSLFTHQELAMAYRSGFERVLFFQESGIRLEGLLRYLGANPIEFESVDQLVEQVLIAFSERRWTTGYSRHLRAIRPRWSDHVINYNHGGLIGHFLYIDIENRRTDAAAYDTVARLGFIRPFTGERYACPNRSHLKATGQPGFVQTIWPQSHGAYDLLVLDHQSAWLLYLNTALDTPQSPLISDRGRYALEYEVLARGFPMLRFTVELELKHVFDAIPPIVRDGWGDGA